MFTMKQNVHLALTVALLMGSEVRSAAAQAAAKPALPTPPVYDVATIKPNKTLSGSTYIDVNDATYKATNVSLKELLEGAYDIRKDLIAGLPGWAESARYDISAKSLADPSVLNDIKRPERSRMLREFLEERFQVKAHIEVKTLPVFDLEVLKDGIKFKPFVPKDSADTGGDMSTNGHNHNVTLTGRGVPMSEFADTLTRRIEHSVLDKTGLPGKYDIQLSWLRDDAPAGGDDAAPTIYTALQEQLGLKLVSSKGLVNTLVIDHIDPPTEN